MERTICDILRDRNNQDPAIVNDALKRYVRKKEKDLNKLMKYAKELRLSPFFAPIWRSSYENIYPIKSFN